LKPDSEIVSGGSGIINEFPTLRILRMMTIAELYNVISDGASKTANEGPRRTARQ
jgi:hypothetical protein